MTDVIADNIQTVANYWYFTKPHFKVDKYSLNVCAPQLAGKYDPQKEEELRLWMEDVTGKRIGENFMESLKDGVLLCECVKLQLY